MLDTSSLLCLIGLSICLITSTDAREALLGAHIARINEFPYQVSIQYPNKRHSCGGGIINDQYILTAGHCVLYPDGRLRDHGMTVIAGTIDLRRNGSPAVIGHAVRAYVPVEYQPMFPSTIGDIAVLKLMQPLDLTKHKHLKAVHLPDNDHDDYAFSKATIAGFGHFSYPVDQRQLRMSKELRYAEAVILENSSCQRAYGLQRIWEKHICARIKHHPHDNSIHGTCFGDSGGLLVLSDNTAVGILSRGPAGCTEKIKPSIYTRVTSYLQFIHNAMRDHENDRIRAFPLKF